MASRDHVPPVIERGALFRDRHPDLSRDVSRPFFRELLPRLESMELAGEPEYTASTFVGGPKRVPIRYRLRPAGRDGAQGSAVSGSVVR